MDGGTTTPTSTTGPDLMNRALALTGYDKAVITDDAPPTAAGWVGYRQLTTPAGLRGLADHAAEHSDATTAQERVVSG